MERTISAVRKLSRHENHLEGSRVHEPQVRVESGTVVRVVDRIQVEFGGGPCEARRAKSCLVAPEVGDKVLCAMEPGGVYVIAVLEGHEGAKTVLAADGDLEVQARAGRLALCSSKGVDLVSGGEVAMTAGELHLRARKGSIAIEELGFFGKLVQAEVARVTLVAREVDSVLTRLTQRAKRVFRFVEEIDQTRAGTVDIRAQNLAAIRGENAIVSARVLAKHEHPAADDQRR
jgi:Protein of unknown function (DUF3540)